ncbi:hypothetical protein [Synergistes jonesii]|uniref:hypothetical protein n=1 Tax=Synergistes jonesii TaxID=2754 RepID=UPI00248DAB0A|nr:hypothetical protein [Synergistes jonesii]
MAWKISKRYESGKMSRHPGGKKENFHKNYSHIHIEIHGDSTFFIRAIIRGKN